VLVILVVTLTPTGGASPPAFSTNFRSGFRWLADGILNVGLFVPLGLVSGWRARSFWKTLGAGALFSAAIEVAQLILPGRDPQLNDIVSNSIGMAIGVALGLKPEQWLRPEARRAGWMLLGASVVVGAVIAITGLLLAPAVVDGYGVGVGTEMLFQRRARLNIRLPPGYGSHEPTSLAAFYDRGGHQVFAITRYGADLLLAYRTRGAVAGLDKPDYPIIGLLAGASATDSLRIQVWRDRPGWCVQAGGPQRCRIGPTFGRGWALLFYPDAIGQRWGRGVDVVWAAALFFPLGFWARRRTLIFAIATTLLLGAAAPLVELMRTTPKEWVGALSGVAVGFACAIALRKDSSTRPA